METATTSGAQIASTGTATIHLNPDGTEIVASWGEWEALPDVRIVRIVGFPDYLQQLHRRHGLSSAGYICHTEEEWRDVPIVTG